MQYIRKLKSSVNKLVYPSGVAQSLGTLAFEPTPKMIDITGLGYNSNTIFENDDSNPSKWQMQRGTYVSRTTLKNGKFFGKMVSIQPRFSNDGTIFPPSKNTWLGAVYSNPSSSMKTIQQKLNIIRNATSYSPVQEIVVFQALVNAYRKDFTPTLGIRVDPSIASVEGLDAIYLKPTMQDLEPWCADIVGSNNLKATALDNEKQMFSSVLVTSDGRLIATTDWLEVSNQTRNNGPDYVANYRPAGSAYYARYNRMFLLIDTYDIDNWKTKLKYIRISGSAGRVEGNYMLPVDQAFIDVCLNAKTKGFEKVALTIITMTGQLFDIGASNIDYLQYTEGVMYRNDLVKDSIEVDPSGNWVKFKTIRPGKYTVWFNNEIYAFEKFTSDGNVTIPKQGVPFTGGGTLEITLNSHGDSGYTDKFVYDIPDTIPPNPPSIISYAADAVYGLCDEGDIVYVERDGVIIGKGTGTSTDTYEAIITNTTLENDQIVFVYTQDTASNKSEKIQGLVKDIISNLKYDLDDTVNAVRSNP